MLTPHMFSFQHVWFFTFRLVTSVYESINIGQILFCRDIGRDNTPLWYMYFTAAVQLLMVKILRRDDKGVFIDDNISMTFTLVELWCSRDFKKVWTRDSPTVCQCDYPTFPLTMCAKAICIIYPIIIPSLLFHVWFDIMI